MELNFIVFLSYLIRSNQLVGYGKAHQHGHKIVSVSYGAIEDCVADEIIMPNDIHKDMNIDYAA